MNANGSDQTRLTNNLGDDYSPDVDPNGDRIAFQSNRTGTVQVYTMNLNGGNVLSVTRLGGSEPGYSPDGRWIAYGNGDILATLATSGPIVHIYNSVTSSTSPAWGP